jgi:hypothetical protein
MEKKPLTIENLVSAGVSQENAEEVVNLMGRYTSDPEFRKQMECEKGHTLKEEE